MSERCQAKDETGIKCDRHRGHKGQHRGYMASIDEPVFWNAVKRLATPREKGCLQILDEVADEMRQFYNADSGLISEWRERLLRVRAALKRGR